MSCQKKTYKILEKYGDEAPILVLFKWVFLNLFIAFNQGPQFLEFNS